MKFGQYVIEDKILNKDTGKKPRILKECSDEFKEQTKILHTVMKVTQKLLETESVLDKTEMALFISNLLTTHINRFLKTQNSYDDDDGGNVFEKKSCPSDQEYN